MHGLFRGPEDLAFTIFHEQVHYTQFTTKGQGDVLSHNKAELAAYQEQNFNLNKFGFDKAVHDAFDKYLNGVKGDGGKINEYAAAVREERWRSLLTFSSEGSAPDLAIHSPKELDDLERHAADVDWEMREGTDGVAAAALRKVRAEAAKQKQLQGADIAEEASRQQADRQAKDDALRAALADIAVRFCSGDGSVDQATLDALPIQNHDRFLNGKMPEAVAAAGCPRKIFMSLGIDLATGRRPTMGEIESADIELPAAGVRPSQFPELKPATPPSQIPAAAALPPILPKLRQLAIDFCDSPGSVSDARLQSFAAYAQDIGGQYWPENYQPGQNGLSSCADEVLRRLILVGRSGRWWSNGLTRETLQSFVPQPPPFAAPPLPPRPYRGQGDSSHCAASQGGACVWRTN